MNDNPPCRFDQLRESMVDVIGLLVNHPGPTMGADYTVLRCILPAGASCPVMKHEDRKTIIVTSGTLDYWFRDEWQSFDAGDLIEVSVWAKHALRNGGSEAAHMIVIVPVRLKNFLLDVAVDPGVPMTASRRACIERRANDYGYVLGSVEDQRRADLPSLPVDQDP